jgi:Ni/Fe-hydrogenase subunit HybB-like protein
MDEIVREEILSKKPARISNLLVFALVILFVLGTAAFVYQAVGSNAKEAWQIYLVNFLFWAGIGQGGIIFSCALRITSGKWGRPILRISEALGSFIPVSFVLLLILFVGKDYVLPYATHPYSHPKDVWLNIHFVFGRNVIGLFILSIFSLMYLYYSIRQDLGGEEERGRCWNKLSRLAPVVVLIYAAVFSIIAWDFMMSLNPHWYSTLFGVYYFVACFIGGICATIIFSIIVRKYFHLQDYITKSQFQDLGKLLFGFSLFWVYMFFSQFLVIWYASLPEEVGFVIKRVQEPPFKALSWLVISCCFFFPLVTLLPRTNKIITPILAFIATVYFCGLWLEKFVLVTPSLFSEIHFGWAQILITLGFFSTFVLTFLLFIRTFPILPVGDPLFSGKIGSHHSGGH